MKTRTGKVARLPRALREELDRRLADGEPANRLGRWLNGLPEVQAVLAAEFGGRPLSAQNLTEWKQGGHREWLARQECLAQARELAASSAEIEQAAGPLGDHLARAVQARYAGALAAWSRDPAKFDRKEFATLRQFGADVALLRHGDHIAGRLRLEHERGEREQFEMDETVLGQFWEWARRPEVQRGLFPYPMTDREKKNRIRAAFGLPPENDEGEDGKEDDRPAGGNPAGPPAPTTPPATLPADAPQGEEPPTAGPPPAAPSPVEVAPPDPEPRSPAGAVPVISPQLERVRRLLFDELPNAPPALVRLGAHAKAEANMKRTPPDVRRAIVRRRLFGERPADWTPVTTTGTDFVEMVGDGERSKGGLSRENITLIEDALHLL